MKILLVHEDQKPWAATFRAEALKKEWVDDEVDIIHCNQLPSGDDYDVIHFLYSGGLHKMRDYALKYKDKVFTSLASERTDIEPLREIYAQTRCCVCHNPMLQEKIKEYRSVYIPNGVDTTLFKREFVVGYVGGIVGKDDYKGLALIEQACKELGLKLRKEEGNTDHKDMYWFYMNIDCLVLASKGEGCNNPTLEALAMNVPVISTDVGIAGYLEGVTLIDRDVESIKSALRQHCTSLQISEDYTWGKVAQRYHDLYVEK